MVLLVTYTFSLDRGISIKLRIGLRVGIVSIFGEDPNSVTACHPDQSLWAMTSRSFDFFIVCYMDSGRRVVRTQIDRGCRSFHLSHLSEKPLPPPPLAAAGRTCHREMSSSSRRFSSRSS